MSTRPEAVAPTMMTRMKNNDPLMQYFENACDVLSFLTYYG